MTCIAALKSNKGVYMGGDRAASNVWGNYAVLSSPKVFRKNSCLIGFAGSFRPAQIVQYCMEMPKKPKAGEELKWMVTQFVPAVQEAMAYNECDDDEYNLMVAVGGRLFVMDSALAILETENDYSSIGDGEQFSDAVLSVVDRTDPEQAIHKALTAAENCCGGVVGPFDILKL